MDTKTLSYLQRQCIKREYCTGDILKKALARTEGDRSAAEELVASLKADRFVDDARYCAAFAREKSALTGWGPVKIRFALRAKGVSEPDIEAGLAEVDTASAGTRLEKLLEVKNRSLDGDPQRKLKLIKFALSRGYEYSDVQKAMENIDNNTIQS